MDITKVKLKKRRIDYSKDIIIHCPTKQDWIDVCKKIEAESNVLWAHNAKPTKYEKWDDEKELSCIIIENNELYYESKKYFEEIYPHTPITSTKNFLCNIVEQPSIFKIDYSETIIIHCPTKQDWIDVCKKIETDSNILWIHNAKPTKYEYWNAHKESSCIIIENDQLRYGSKEHYKKHHPHTFITSAKDFLGK